VWNGDIDAWATIKPSLPYLDYFVPSIDEARLMVKKEAPEDIAAALIDEGVGTVCLKMGAEGVYIRSRDEKLLIPAFRTEVADTSGVGDSWIAGFLAGLCKDWSVEESARLGAAMGALCVQAIGTTAGLRNLEETLEFMNTADTLE
jgi:sugar/nucleoside kinase (ribokinase family)